MGEGVVRRRSPFFGIAMALLLLWSLFPIYWFLRMGFLCSSWKARIEVIPLFS